MGSDRPADTPGRDAMGDAAVRLSGAAGRAAARLGRLADLLSARLLPVEVFLRRQCAVDLRHGCDHHVGRKAQAKATATESAVTGRPTRACDQKLMDTL